MREFKPATWEFGPVYEVEIEKTLTCNKLGMFLQTNLFPHIPLNSLFGANVRITTDFVRSDLALKSWKCISNQNVWVGQSSLTINRDSVLIVVKDFAVRTKEL